MIIQACIANTHEISNPGIESFTLNDLLTMSNTAAGIPVTREFRTDTTIGVVCSAFVKSNLLIANIELFYEVKPKPNSSLFIVPGVILSETKKVLRIFECSLTERPAMPGLTPVSTHAHSVGGKNDN